MINPNKTGFVLAIVMGGWHMCWSLLVATGMAQPIINFIFNLHFIKPIYMIESFAISKAIVLVLFTSFVGYVLGLLSAVFWNKMHQ